MTFDWSKHYAPRAKRMAASEIREILKLLDLPDIISFAGGIPDPKLFPVAEIKAAYNDILSNPELAGSALQYSISEGYLPLRKWIADYMQQRGVEGCSAENILITSGSQQGLDFIGKLFIQPGDVVLTDAPTYLGALQAFNAYEPVYDLLPGPTNNRGVADYGKNGQRNPKFGYAMPEFQNPSGRSLTREQREELLDFADSLELPLVEDSPYEKLRYEGEVAEPILAMAAKRAGGLENAGVMYLGTFSKTVVPSLRIGWVCAPKALINKLVLVKQGADLHVSCLSQMVMYRVASQIMEPHTAKVRGIYKRRRDAMLAALEKYMPQGAEWTRPEGGLFIWVTLPAGVDGHLLLERAIRESRVAFVPGGAFYADRSGKNTLRLSFCTSDEIVIEEGIKRLGGLLTTVLTEKAA